MPPLLLELAIILVYEYCPVTMSNWHAAKISGRRRGTNGQQKRAKGKAKGTSASTEKGGSSDQRKHSNKTTKGKDSTHKGPKPPGSRQYSSAFSRRPLIDNSSRYDVPPIEEEEDDDSVRCDVLQPIDPNPFFATVSLGDPLANVSDLFMQTTIESDIASLCNSAEVCITSMKQNATNIF